MYATVTDMIERFGQVDMVRLSKPEDHAATTVDSAKIQVALGDATALINDYLRGRYVVPVAAPPESVVRAACVLARYDLAHGARSEPTEQMRLARKDVIAWLDGIAAGSVVIDAPATGGAATGGSGARISDRSRAFGTDELRDW